MNHVTEFTVVCFDVAGDRRRRRIVRVLESRGYRAQESVFECWLDAGQRRKLATELEREIDASEDRIVIYVLTPTDYADIASLGRGLPIEDFYHAIL